MEDMAVKHDQQYREGKRRQRPKPIATGFRPAPQAWQMMPLDRRCEYEAANEGGHTQCGWVKPPVKSHYQPQWAKQAAGDLKPWSQRPLDRFQCEPHQRQEINHAGRPSQGGVRSAEYRVWRDASGNDQGCWPTFAKSIAQREHRLGVEAARQAEQGHRPVLRGGDGSFDI